MDKYTIARILGGKVSGGNINCPGEGHSDEDGSISIRIEPSAPGGLLVFDHAGGNHLAAKDFVLWRLGRDRPGGGAQVAHPFEPTAERDHVRHDPILDRTALALRIWREAQPAAGSPVETYLWRRGLGLPADPHEVIRFAPACPFAGTRTPAMIALVRNVVTDEPQAIHRTALTLDGRKAIVNGRDRLALGGLRGGAVKLTADAEVTYCLGIGEGIESTLSLRSFPEFGDTPAWAVLNAAGVAGFMPLPGIESLWIAVDHDPAGEMASATCSGRWRFAGKEVFRVKAKAPGADLNDIVEARRD
ncbi:hypothetical protein QO012_001462 [Methylobacterium aerolatum]|uniref:Virulence-associated protein E n=2 Tax=Methylobacterium aerolatum TaxID=418708 RepID=A0ABU0HXD3_9HYPH|nr:toprim domain-containing protein [Methylobacterium aerolatum]MDQ0446971.1 hypothetical protein [Methylobacterium aerolatum]